MICPKARSQKQIVRKRRYNPVVWKGKTLRRLVPHPSPRGKAVNNRIQSRLLTLCFRYVKAEELKVFVRLGRQAREDFVAGGAAGKPVGKKISDRISERLHRLCFHWVRDHERELLAELRKVAEVDVIEGRNGAGSQS
jgi:hypothetical protein